MLSLPSSDSVAIGTEGSRISTFAFVSMSPAVTVPGPSTFRRTVSGWSLCTLRGTFLRLRMMSVVSSTTPGIDENSCSTPSIFTAVTAAPSRADSRILRIAFPMVVPNPRSNGWAQNFPYVSVSVAESTSSRFGF